MRMALLEQNLYAFKFRSCRPKPISFTLVSALPNALTIAGMVAASTWLVCASLALAWLATSRLMVSVIGPYMSLKSAANTSGPSLLSQLRIERLRGWR